MSRKLVPLLPANLHGSFGPQPPPKLPNNEPPKRKRPAVRIACNNCRRRKARCDGLNPSCSPCKSRSEACTYIDPEREKLKRRERRGSEYSDAACELLSLLKAAPGPQSVKILQLWRVHGDPAVVVSIFKSRTEGESQSSENDMSLESSETPDPPEKPISKFEVELMAYSPSSFPSPRPYTTLDVEENPLLKLTESNRLDAPIFTPTTPPKHGSPHPSVGDTSGYYLSEEALETLIHSSHTVVDSQPSTPPNSGYCDDRLSSLNISFWTDVEITDKLAAHIISLYLVTDHPLLGVFDPETFIGDLVAQNNKYCSPLLVCSILYLGCQMYTLFDNSASELARRFLEEAQTHWLQESMNDSILNIAATQILSLAYMGQGKDHQVMNYLRAGALMSHRIGLFGANKADMHFLAGQLCAEEKRAASFAAWGAFNWLALTSLFYRQPGMEYPKYSEYPETAPALPIPGHQSRSYRGSGQTSSTSSQLSSGVEVPSPYYMGSTFTSLCQFWRIVHEVVLLYHKVDNRKEKISLQFAEFKYRELLAWSETLPASMLQGEEQPHHVIVFHIWFHCVILDVFRPFVQINHGLRLRTFAAPDSNPLKAFDASVNQLRRLVLIYRSNFEEARYSLLWHTGLQYLANAMLKNTSDPEWRYYFLACTYGYENLRRSYRVAEAMTGSLLSMAMRNGDVLCIEARRLLYQLRDHKTESQSDEDIRAPFMGDIDLAMTDPEAASVENLAASFDDLALFSEFTNPEHEELLDW